MPYIGKSPVGGGFHKLDNLTASATATYALTLGGAAYYPETANQLLVSLNGVIQAPQDSFTVSGSNLVFDSALTASDSIDFVVALGDVLGVQGVTDGTVTTAKIANGAVTMDKLATSGTLPALDGSNLTGISSSVAVIADQKAYNVGGGNAVGGFNDRDLNTEIFDPDGIVSISSNQFTLNAGTYIIEFSSVAYDTNRTFTELYDVTNSATAGQGMTRYSVATYNGETASEGYAQVTPSVSTTYKIRTYAQSSATDGLGIAHNASGNDNIYTLVKITKIA